MNPIILIDPPPTSRFGNMRHFGSIGTYKADIAYPPIDLLKVAGALRIKGLSCLVIDANTQRLTQEEVLAILEKERPRLVACITSTTALVQDMLLMRRVKELLPETLTVTFGAHLKGAPEETLREFPGLDVAIFGDQEWVIPQLAESSFDPANVPGICYRRGETITRNPPHPAVTDLDEYGIPAHDLVDRDLYRDPFVHAGPLTVTYGTMGCINDCTYCMSNLYRPLRTRSVDHFLRELVCIRKLGFKEVFFIDCGLTNDHRWVNELLDRMIADSIGLRWWCLSRADRLNDALLAKMRLAGCHSVGIGVESAHPQIIRNIRKRVNLPLVRNMVKVAHHHRLRVLLYFQFGLPGETRETMRTTLQFALRSGADLATFGIAVPVPGTEFFEYIQRNGFFNTRDWSRFDPTLPPVYDYPGLSSREIFEFSQAAYRTFYFRPGFILRKLLHQRSFAEFRSHLKNGLLLLQRLTGSHAS